MMLRRSLVPATVFVALATASPASAQVGDLPIDPPGLPGLPGLPPGGGTLPGELPGGELPGGLPGVLPGSGSDPGAAPGTGTQPSGDGQGGTLDASGPVISGPKKASTVRVDSKGRFRVSGVVVTCPAACTVSVGVSTANGGTVRFVKRTYTLAPGASLKLKKLKVAKKGLRALRSMGVARAVASLKASATGAPTAKRSVGLKLKPARR